MKHLTILIVIVSALFSCATKSNNSEDSEIQQAEVLNPKIDFQPNIVWLVAEDLSPVIPAYGDSTIVTPTLDRLGAEGVVYDNFFSAHPVCSPARASIITGMYANHIGASHMRTGPWWDYDVPEDAIEAYSERAMGGLPVYEAMPEPGVKMFTEYLRAKGYYCTNNSKQDYQFRRTATAWDESSNTAHWRDREEGQPFFAVFNFGITHESQIWARAEDSLWVDEDLEVPVPPYLPDNEIGQTDVRRMYSNVKIMDQQVGEIIKQLEDDGLLENTIIVWYTDHGGPLPRQKRLLFDSGLKVPMIIRFPGRQFAGMRDDRMTSFIDLAATTLSLVGIEPPAYMDGSAFLGEYLRSEEPEYVFGAADRFDEKMDRNRSVRDKRFKYIKYYMPEKPMLLDVAYRNQQPIMQELHRLHEAGELTPEQALWFRETKPEEELFDITKDPHELNNLADDPEYTEDLQRMREALNDWLNSIDDTGLIPEVELRERIRPNGVARVMSEPVFSREGNQISISCETEGASIGYKVLGPEDVADSLVWSVYVRPFEIGENESVIAIADRIGYDRSKVVALK